MPAPLNDAYTVAPGPRVYAGRFPTGLRGAAQLQGLGAAGGMALARSQASGAALLAGVGTAGSMVGAVPVPYQVAADGVWTWFTDPRALQIGDDLWIGSLRSNGRPNVNKFNLTSRTGAEFVLTGTFQTDDHNNAALHQLADGRILAGYSKHNDSDGNRYRITTTPGGIGAWTTEVVIPSGGLAGYTTFHHLSVTNKLYWHFRRGLNRQYAISTADYATWDAEREWVSNGSERPYIKACNNGSNRIDFVFTNGHPNGTTNSLWHGYLIVGSDGSETFYKSDGTLIGAGPLTPANATRIWDGTTAAGEAWSWQIAYGADGRPRVLFAVFPTTTDHRYMHARWDGSAWQTNQIIDGGPYLYAAEANYSGGLCFDGNNTNIVYVSRHTGVTWEIQDWRTADNGATWTKYRDITSGSAAGYVNGRPFSPKAHDGRACCIWWAGTYTTFTDFSTAVMAIGAY